MLDVSKILENPLVIGGGAIGAVQLVSALPVEQIIEVVVQIVIGLATLVRLFKKNKPTEPKP
jgi:hypothetical protein